MNQSIITGLGTPQLSRIVEEGESNSRRTDQVDELDTIQEQIAQIGKQLESLYHEMKQMPDKYSEQYLQKENKRNNLRKHLIDLDYQHKTIFARRQKNNGNSIIKQFDNPPSQPSTPKNKEKYQRENVLFASPVQSPKIEKEKVSVGTGLEESKRRLRICQIESQLAEQKLRRSRVQRLTRELVYLRTSYSYPYSLQDYYPEYYYPTYSSLYSHWWLY